MSDTRTPVKSLGEMLYDAARILFFSDQIAPWNELHQSYRDQFERQMRGVLSRFRACGKCGGKCQIYILGLKDTEVLGCTPCPACKGLGLVAREGE